MYNFSRTSSANLSTCHRDLQIIAHHAINFVDFTVVQGHRDEETQNRYFARGVSKVQWPNSKHNLEPSEAMDLAPHHSEYGILFGGKDQVKLIHEATGLSEAIINQIILREYFYLAGVIMTHAQLQGIILRWGGDWDRDKDYFDNRFNDLGHFEIFRG